MGTLVLDFDSTLVPCESLELVLSRAAGAASELHERIAEITRRGMEGEISFRDSLDARLALARPDRAGVEAAGAELAAGLTAGAAAMVRGVAERGHEVWIVSGGFREILLPTGRVLGIPDDRVCGVSPRWAGDGSFAGLAATDAFATSKVAGVRALGREWPRPAVGVGDGMTDHALLRAGLVDHFVTFTEHVRRPAVVAQGAPEAADMAAVIRMLETLLP